MVKPVSVLVTAVLLALAEPPLKQAGFVWRSTQPSELQLTFENRPVLRYVNVPFDDSTREKREATYKPFHHLMTPDGSRPVTKGLGGIYPHQRGLFFGFNKISYGDGKAADLWHCTGDAYQDHRKELDVFVGPESGGHVVEIGWHGPGKELFAVEKRKVTAHKKPGGQLVDFESTLTAVVDSPIKLDGDPQHSGFQIRLDNEINEKSKGQTYFLRPDGRGKPGETRNYDPEKKQGPTNLPWNAMSFVLGDKRYTLVYLDHPDNPKPAYWSERDYGRFGYSFQHMLTQGKPLKVKYRLWLQDGEMTVEECKRLSW